MKKRTIPNLLMVLLMLGALLAACGGSTESDATTAAPDTTADTAETTVDNSEESPAAPESKDKTLTIGFTASQTGSKNVSSTRQINGFMQWMEEINGAGGIVLSDGAKITFEAVSYNDESDSERVKELYTQLAAEDDVDFLISPYSSGLTAAAAIVAEQYGKVMITTGAASDSAYKQGYTTVYQAYTPASRYMTGSIDLLRMLDPDVSKVAFVYENSNFSTAVAEAAKAYAEGLGYEVVLYEGYDPETIDFSSFLNRLEAAEPDAVLGGGHFLDGSTFARQINQQGTAVNFLALLVAPPDPDFADLGAAAYGVIGPSQWEPLAAFTPESADAAGLEWFGPLSDDFVTGYEFAYNGEEPSYHSAGGYAAGLILQKAIADADSTDPAAVRAVLDNMDMLTFFGHIKFDISAEAHGLQIGHSMVYIQWQYDENGELLKQVVWPLEGATADTIYPME